MKQNERYDALTQELLEKPCWVIDFLPRRVPEKSGGHFFEVEQFYLDETRRPDFFRRFAQILLGVFCYCDLVSGDGETWSRKNAPQKLYDTVAQLPLNGYRCVLLPGEEALFTVSGSDLYMTVYNPSETLLDLIRPLVHAQGLFLRKGADQ
ncbi:MAG: hypothetical protein II713_01010 [Clostridia bacterium]|nr:hypothetical protein [Clostridia bacterium]